MIRRITPAIGLFFLSPLIAEYLLGDFPLTHLGPLLFLAPMYGGGALLIREIVRHTSRGWPTIVVLALAYGILEEAFMTQTLFNPNYLGMNLHLLDHAYVPAFGMGAWWTVFVLTLHTVWSISVPICLVESMVPERANEPWLRTPGLVLITALFLWMAVTSAIFSARQDKAHFVASVPQFAWAAIFFLLVAAAAFFLPRNWKRASAAPNPWFVGAFALVTSSLFLLVRPEWGWKAFGAVVGLELIAVIVIVFWACSSGCNGLQRLALAGGAALSYAWHGFIQNPVVGKAGVSMRVGNAVLALGLIVLLAMAFRRVRENLVGSSIEQGRASAAG